jgi:hypothetical protein
VSFIEKREYYHFIFKIMNPGYNPENIKNLKIAAEHVGRPFVMNDSQESDDQSAYFLFVGKNDGKEVIYDAFLYTLRAEYELQLYEAAETLLQEKFPNLKNIEEATPEQLDYLDLLADEIEQRNEIGVVEFINIDENVEMGVAIDVCLNVETITPDIIETFINDFNNDTLELDDTEYSFSPYINEED